MKQKTIFTIFLFGVLLSVTTACGSDDHDGRDDSKIITYAELPEQTKTFITNHFGDYRVEQTKQNSDSYSVTLYKTVATRASAGDKRNGYEIEFDRQGNWIEIEGKNDTALPGSVLALIPRSILTYLNANYANRGINEVKKETYGYRIELSGNPDVELKFDTNGSYIAKEGENNSSTIAKDLLPERAKTFLSTHFNAIAVLKVEKDNDGYDVELIDKTDIDFDLQGTWKEVDVDKNTMPQTIMDLLPKKLTDYLKANYANKKVESIKNKISAYEIELAGDVNLVFDKSGTLWSAESGNTTDKDKDGIELDFLPQEIQKYLTLHFLVTGKFLYAEKDDDDYEVKLVDGTQIEFTLGGALKSVEVLPGNNVPDGVINQAVLTYVKANYATKKIEEYQVKTVGFKVELSGYPEIELLFDTQGRFMGIDN